MNGKDVCVIGGGIAGASISFELAATRSVRLLEAETALAAHTTGRSAATWISSYGPALVRRLTAASLPALTDPEAPWGNVARPMGALTVAGVADAAACVAEHAQVCADDPGVHFELLDAAGVRRVNPLVRTDAVEVGSYEPGALDLDVHALHSGYVRGARARGVDIRTGGRIVGAQRRGQRWVLADSAGGSHECSEVVIAAGAWGDEVGALFGAAALGLRPLRRTLFACPVADSAAVRGLPLTGDQAGTWYWRPEAAGVLCSPSEEAPDVPGVPRVDELDVARALEAINTACQLGLRRVSHAWAGLRTFAADGCPVAGPDPQVPGVHWYVGQGGYGIQMSTALARTAVALIAGESMPQDVADRGVQAADLLPHRVPRLTA